MDNKVTEVKPAPGNALRVYKCESWDDFIAKLRIQDRPSGRHLYRGQRLKLNWKLSSHWERSVAAMIQPEAILKELGVSDTKGFMNRMRDGYRERFAELAKGTPGLRSDSFGEDDWWVLGRHHGLLTPLLDWTRSPFIAAFFAYIDFLKREEGSPIHISQRTWKDCATEDIAVWCLARTDSLLATGDLAIIDDRRDDFHRQRAQQGCFTRLTHDDHLDLESYLAGRNLTHLLERFEIPGGEMSKALTDLERMNINSATLFPDLDGAANEANLVRMVQSMEDVKEYNLDIGKPVGPADEQEAPSAVRS